MKRIGQGVAVLLVMASVGRAQATTPADLSDAQKDLRALVSAQESYFVDNDAYTNQIAALKRKDPSSGVSITITDASSTGWSAVATVSGIKNASCAIFVGKTTIAKTAGGKEPEKEGQPVCDSPAPGAKSVRW
jgi:secreted trypsin-like serine protease